MMKKTLPVAAILIFAFALNCVAQETCERYAEPEIGLSFCLPEGWSIEKRDDSKFDIVVGPRADNFTPNIGVAELKVPVSIKDVVSYTIKYYTDNVNAKKLGAAYIKVLNQSEFITSSKAEGIKVVFESENKGQTVLTTQYFFSRKEDSKLVVTFTSLEKGNEVHGPAVDRSMKTLRIDQ